MTMVVIVLNSQLDISSFHLKVWLVEFQGIEDGAMLYDVVVSVLQQVPPAAT